MCEDDETTACQLHAILVDRGYKISLLTVLRCRTSLGWTFRGSSYCQLLRDANQTNCLLWAQEHISDNFENVVWTDECTAQLETHRRFCRRKQGQPPKPKPRYMCAYTASAIMKLTTASILVRVHPGCFSQYPFLLFTKLSIL